MALKSRLYQWSQSLNQCQSLPLGGCLLVLGLLASPTQAQTPQTPQMVASADAELAIAATAIGAAPVSVLVLPEGTPDLGSELLSSLSYAAGQSTNLLQASQSSLLTPDSSPGGTPAIAQTEGAPSEAVPPGPPVALARLGVRYTTEGPGYQSGFTTFEGFVPLAQTPGESLTFLEGRLLLLNNSTLGTNVIIGQRFYNAEEQRVYGGYIAYDNRDTGRSFFNQLSFGVEALSDAIDLRLNAYIPIGTTRNVVGFDRNVSLRFSGNSLLLTRNIQYEAAATVVDAEVGTRLFPIGDVGSVRGYAGTYYINAPGSPDVVGIRGRLEAKASDFFNLNLMLQNDSLFDTRLIASVGVNFPGTISTPSGAVDERYRGFERIGDSVVRQSAILVADPSVRGQSNSATEAAINARTGRPYRVVHVASGSSGSGTNESPLGSVQAALGQVGDGDLIYVRGSGTETLTNPTLAGSIIFSSAPTPQLTPDVVAQFGQRVALPTTYVNASDRYILSSNTTVRITGNNVTVAGLTLNSPNGPGISANGVSNLTLTGNTINTPAGRGIDLTNVTGTLTVTGNTVNGTTGALNSGLALQNSAGSVTFDISGNTITGTTNSGVGLRFTGTAQATGTLSNNTISGNQGSGIAIQALDSSQVTTTISNNQIFNNTGFGIELRAENSGILRTTVSSNPRITPNTLGGIAAFSSGNGQLFLSLQANPSVTGNGGQDLRLDLLNNTSRLCLLANNNVFGTVQGNNAAGGTYQVEGGFPGTNTVTTNAIGAPTVVPAGTCGF